MTQRRRLLKKLRRPGEASPFGSTSLAGQPIEIWFQDEARVGQKGGHAYIWAEKGSVR